MTKTFRPALVRAVLVIGALISPQGLSTPLGLAAGPDARIPEGLEGLSVPLQAPSAKGSPSSVRRLGLGEALDIGLSDNLDLALARAEVQIARGRRLAVQARLFPSFEGALRGRRRDGRVQGSFGKLRDVTFNTFNDSVALVYGANLGARLHEAFAERREMDASLLGALRAEQKLLLRVAELYQNLLLTTAAVRIAEEVVSQDEQFLGIARARAEGGLGLGSDVARAQAKLAADRQELVTVRSMRDEVGMELAVALRLDLGVPIEPREASLEPLHFKLGGGPDAAVADLAATRPDVRAARERAEAARHHSAAARWELFSPELRALFAWTAIGDEPADLDGRQDRGAALVWTISPEEVGELRKRRAEQERARLGSVRTEEAARAEIMKMRRDLTAVIDRIPHTRSGLEAAEENLRLSQARFRSGTAIALEVLDAENVRAEARLGLARDIVAYNLSQIRLLAATGLIDRSSFAP
ncbi:MAG: TolC family protein [Acidobacteriota bacterium]